MPDDDDDLFTDADDGNDQDNSVIRGLRERADKVPSLEKQLTKKDQELQELRQFKAEQEGRARVSSAEKAFETAGLPTGLADLFAEKHEGDITEEAVKSWAEARGLKPPEEKPAEQEQAPAAGVTIQGTTFTPTVAGQPPSQEVALSEVDRLMAEGKYEQAGALLEKGIKQGSIEWDEPEAAKVADSLRGR